MLKRQQPGAMLLPYIYLVFLVLYGWVEGEGKY